jgi:hypothetical protein
MLASQAKTSAALAGERRRVEGRIAAGILVALVTGVVLVAFYPGSLNYDAEQTIREARSGDLTDWWTPMGSLALRGWFELGLGLGSVYVVEIVLFTTGVFALTRHALSPVWAAVATAVIVLWPPTSSLLSTLSRDIFFFGVAMFALAALASAYRAAAVDRKRCGCWVAAALLLAFISMLIRQNGVTLVLVVAGAGFVLLRRTPASPLRTAAAVAGVAIAAGLLSFVITTGMNRALGVDKAHPEQMVYQYDLAAMSTDLNEQLFDAKWVAEPTAWGEPIYSLRSLKRHFEWKNVLTLFPPLSQTRPGFKPNSKDTPQWRADRLREQWLDAITSHPLTYLKVRLRVNLSGLGFHDRPFDAYPFIVEDFGPVGQSSLFGAPPRFTNRNRQARNLLGKFAGPNSAIPLDIVFLYVVLAVAAALYLWRRWHRDRGLVLAIAMVAVLNVLLLLPATMATSYRYLALVTPLSMVLVAWAIAQFLADRKAE